MKCHVCGKGPLEDGVTVFRVNETGVQGVWACREHLPEEVKVDPEVTELITIIEEDTRYAFELN